VRHGAGAQVALRAGARGLFAQSSSRWRATMQWRGCVLVRAATAALKDAGPSCSTFPVEQAVERMSAQLFFLLSGVGPCPGFEVRHHQVAARI
jgi:hypothetical protein